MFWEILNRIIGRKKRIIGTGLSQRRSDMRSDYVTVLLTQQLLSLRPDLTFSVFGLVIW